MSRTPLGAYHGRLLLMGRANDAADDHHQAIRASRSGVTQAALDQDIGRWHSLAFAIADLARLVSGHCAASAFCDARPTAGALAVRLVEAIDDQIDPPAWRVVNAEVRLRTGAE